MLGVFGVFALMALIDYIELMRRAADLPNVSALLVARASFFRVPQVTERIMPFCVLVGAMSCYLNLSRRIELVVARAAGMSAWQFVAPAVIVALLLGALAATVYNPMSALLQERSKRLEAELFGQDRRGGLHEAAGGGFWVRQRSAEGQAIINALSSREQGVQLGGVTVFTFAPSGRSRSASRPRAPCWSGGTGGCRMPASIRHGIPPATRLLPSQDESDARPGARKLRNARNCAVLATAAIYRYRRTRRPRGIRLSAAIPEAAIAAVPACRHGAAGGGVQPAVLPLRRRAEDGLGRRRSGFLLYVLSKVTEDMSKAELMHPVAAAWLPVFVGE